MIAKYDKLEKELEEAKKYIIDLEYSAPIEGGPEYQKGLRSFKEGQEKQKNY